MYSILNWFDTKKIYLGDERSQRFNIPVKCAYLFRNEFSYSSDQ